MTISDNIKEALLEGGRVVLLAVVSYLLTASVLAAIVAKITGGNVDTATQLIVVGLFTSILRGIDKWLHEKAKDEGNVDKGLLGAKGLTGF